MEQGNGAGSRAARTLTGLWQAAPTERGNLEHPFMQCRSVTERGAGRQNAAQHFQGSDGRQSRERKCTSPSLLTAAIIYPRPEYGEGSDKFTVLFGWMRMTSDG